MELSIGVTAVVNKPRVAIHRAQLGHHVIRDSPQFPCLREDDRMQPGREVGIGPDLQGDPQQQRRLTTTPRPDHDRVLVHSPAFRRAIPSSSELLATHLLATSMLGTGSATSRPLVPQDAAWGSEPVCCPGAIRSGVPRCVVCAASAPARIRLAFRRYEQESGKRQPG